MVGTSSYSVRCVVDNIDRSAVGDGRGGKCGSRYQTIWIGNRPARSPVAGCARAETSGRSLRLTNDRELTPAETRPPLTEIDGSAVRVATTSGIGRCGGATGIAGIHFDASRRPADDCQRGPTAQLESMRATRVEDDDWYRRRGLQNAAYGTCSHIPGALTGDQPG